MRPRLISEDRLLDQLLAAFADLGFDGASIRAICRHLGMSHNMINQRYPSKEAAWTAAVDHAFSRLTAGLLAPLPEDVDPPTALRTVMRRWVDVTIDQPTLARIIHQESGRPGPRFDYMFQNYIGPVQEQTRSALLELQRTGAAIPGPISAAYFFLTTWGIGGIASLQELARQAGADGDDPREAAYLAIEIVIRGILA